MKQALMVRPGEIIFQDIPVPVVGDNQIQSSHAVQRLCNWEYPSS